MAAGAAPGAPGHDGTLYLGESERKSKIEVYDPE
jgi:hypothetical protein